MKKIIIICVALLLITACFITCPKKDAHQKAIMEIVDSALNEKSDEKNGLELFASFLGSSLADKVVGQTLEIDNYYLFSLGRLKFGDKEKSVSLGFLNQTFVFFDKEDLLKIVEDKIK